MKRSDLTLNLFFFVSLGDARTATVIAGFSARRAALGLAQNASVADYGTEYQLRDESGHVLLTFQKGIAK